jgi:hypothetical protein
MRALVLVAMAALLLAAPARAATLWPQPEQYDAALRYHPHAHLLGGRERIAFRNTGPSTLRSVWLRVWPNGYGSCSRRWARVTVLAGGRAAGWRVGCTALRVRLRAAVDPGAAGAVKLRLRVKVPPRPDRFGRDRHTVFLGNALPLLAVEDAHGPALEPYTNLGDPFYSLSSRWSVRLDMPARLRAATTGVAHGRRTRVGGGYSRMRIAASHARDFAIVIGAFAVDTTVTSDGVRLRRFRPRGTTPRWRRGRLVRRWARTAVEKYGSWYGPVGWREIDMAPAPGRLGADGFGMEFPGLVLGDTPGTITHELAHQWWYGMVGNDEWRSPWLDESFAEFSALRLPLGTGGVGCHGRRVRRFGHDRLTSSMRHWDAVGVKRFFYTVYRAGPCALRSLQSDWGFGKMTAFLRSYATAHRFGVVTTADFVAALRAAAPGGYDVDAFLKRARIAP